MVSSGRSVGQFCIRAGVTVPLVTLFSVGSGTLLPEEIATRERIGFHAVMGPDSPTDRFHAIEALMDPGYPSVHQIAIDAASRAVVRAMTPDDQTHGERECAEFVGSAVTELVEVIHRRSLRFDGVGAAQIKPLLQQASRAVLKLQHHAKSPSYLAKNTYPQGTRNVARAAVE
jgi:hypothetical protein